MPQLRPNLHNLVRTTSSSPVLRLAPELAETKRGTLWRPSHQQFRAWPSTGGYRTNVWEYRGVNTLKAGRLDELALHPTVKPVAMIADAIKDVSRRGGIVLDLFGGSGSTLIAAHKTRTASVALRTRSHLLRPHPASLGNLCQRRRRAGGHFGGFGGGHFRWWVRRRGLS
jgi:hypothetical protein